MPYRDLIKTDIPGAFIELCKYQQSIIKQYEEYIEKYLHQPIKEEDHTEYFFEGPLMMRKQHIFKKITIPETKLIIDCSPAVLYEWKWLKETTPLISPDYFIDMAYKEREEQKNAEAN